MPEAAVHEDAEAPLGEGEVRFSAKISMPTPACDAGIAQHLGELGFGGEITLAAHQGHDDRSAGLAENVGHTKSLPPSSFRTSEIIHLSIIRLCLI